MKKTISLLYIVLALLLIGCGSDDTSGRRGRIKKPGSSTKQLITKNIDKLGESRWDKKKYVEIRDNQIAILNGSQNAKRALLKKLDKVYSEVLVKEGNLLMDNNCGGNHNKLSQVMAELKNFPNAPQSAGLNERYKEHQEILSFVNSIGGKQHVRSYKDKYDTSYETKIKNQAAAFLKKDIKCAFLKNKLTSTNAAFKARRSNFCSSVVNLFCGQSSYSRAEDNILRDKIVKVNGRMEKSWEAKLDQFKARNLHE